MTHKRVDELGCMVERPVNSCMLKRNAFTGITMEANPKPVHDGTAQLNWRLAISGTNCVNGLPRCQFPSNCFRIVANCLRHVLDERPRSVFGDSLVGTDRTNPRRSRGRA